MERRVLVLLVASLVACSDHGASTAAPPPPAGAPPTSGPSGGPRSGGVDLPSGESGARFEINAADPSKHELTVTVRMPKRARIAVRAETENGAQLQIFDSALDASSCQVVAHEDVCHLRFGFLDGQRGGQWTVVVRKRSQPRARVVVTFHFD
jgi:hypothetical protein